MPWQNACEHQTNGPKRVTASTDDTPAAPIEVPDLTAYRLRADPAPMVPAEPRRAWMNATDQRFAYRCIPMPIANATGWKLLSPVEFNVSWTGGNAVDAVKIWATEDADTAQVNSFISSHFGHGILTFSPGDLFHTSPGWALWVRGAPNERFGNLHPLEGIVETDWLPFTFTMNWRFGYPGEMRVPKGERLCFVTPVAHSVVGDIQPRIRDITENPDLAERFRNWSNSRDTFNAGLKSQDPETVKQGWEKRYVKGDTMGSVAPNFHINKRRMKKPLMPGE